MKTFLVHKHTHTGRFAHRHTNMPSTTQIHIHADLKAGGFEMCKQTVSVQSEKSNAKTANIFF